MSNYNKVPFLDIKIDGIHAWEGYNDICLELKEQIEQIRKEKEQVILVIDCYPGVFYLELENFLIDVLCPVKKIFTDKEIFYSSDFITKQVEKRMSQDRVFGYWCQEQYEDFIDKEKQEKWKEDLKAEKGLIIIYGALADVIETPDIYIYADMARWEIQQRFRRKEITNWKCSNPSTDNLINFKWGYFFEWRIADRHKKRRFSQFDYILDTNQKKNPKMITGNAFREGILQTVNQPFRVTPFFDPGVWGGQWMKNVCQLEENHTNYAWCFDCVLEENSVLFKITDILVELPAIDIVLFAPYSLLGEKVFARFGAEFPIRFDFLDTIEGQNLSLQVHPTVDYIQEKFGMHYTQEESYYILDAKEDAAVYLGVKTGIKKEDFFQALEKAQKGAELFEAEKFVNKIQVKKHDHILIPPGTLHCSGKNTMVLEISSTPYIFTFKLWDWGRVGLDGKPRPISIEHGKEVVHFERDTKWVKEELVNNVQLILEEDGLKREHTGLHSLEFIETIRDWFSKKVIHNTNESVNVLNLVEGEEAIIESPQNAFQPFIVHYAETFIIPEAVKTYSIRPYGKSEGKTIAIIKAFVRVAS